MAYVSPGEKAPFGLTENEMLFDRVTSKRLKEIINNKKYRLTYNKRDTNNYGEFRFITLIDGKDAITFWGNGFHEMRDCIYIKTWFFYINPIQAWSKGTDLYKPMDDSHKKHAIQIIDFEAEDLEEDAREHYQSKQGKLFTCVANLTDDDAAMSMLEDGEF